MYSIIYIKNISNHNYLFSISISENTSFIHFFYQQLVLQIIFEIAQLSTHKHITYIYTTTKLLKQSCLKMMGTYQNQLYFTNFLILLLTRYCGGHAETSDAYSYILLLILL